MTPIKPVTYEFPGDLARRIKEIWSDFIMGDYSPPPLPSDVQLRSLIDVAFLASLEREEGRYLNFNLCVIPEDKEFFEQIGINVWKFTKPRNYNMQDIIQLGSVSNLENSGICICFPKEEDNPPYIQGLLDFGTSWSKARKAQSYISKSMPQALLISVNGPGLIKIYQGDYLLLTYKKGNIQQNIGPSSLDLVKINYLLNKGLDSLSKEFKRPKSENYKECVEFEYIAYINVILAILNEIEQKGHGGALIFVDQECDFLYNNEKTVKIKYTFNHDKDYLKKAFIKFINNRHDYIDLLNHNDEESEEILENRDVNTKLNKLNLATNELMENCLFISNLANIDGAVILRSDLTIEGFGTEILLERVKQTKVYSVSDPIGNIKHEFDLEQRGMRHRSAFRLCATLNELAIFVISQDGGVSLVWKDDNQDVCVKSPIKTVNANFI